MGNTDNISALHGAPAVCETKINPKDAAEMIRIPAGEFWMGDEDCSQRRRKVTLPAYWIYKSPVSVCQYKKYCAAVGKEMPVAPDFNSGWCKLNDPMVHVSLKQAKEYCRWAGVRLPSSKQWEKAARGTDGRKFPWGDRFDRTKLWASKKGWRDAGGTTAVGAYGVSPYGCTDMAGNVAEWYAESITGSDDPFWPPGFPELPVIWNTCGGAWTDTHELSFRTAFRDYTELRMSDRVGFRCCTNN